MELEEIVADFFPKDDFPEYTNVLYDEELNIVKVKEGYSIKTDLTAEWAWGRCLYLMVQSGKPLDYAKYRARINQFKELQRRGQCRRFSHVVSMMPFLDTKENFDLWLKSQRELNPTY